MAGPGPTPYRRGPWISLPRCPGAGTPEAEITADQMSLGRRLRQPRTILSLVLPIFLLILFARSLPGFNLAELPAKILAANGWLLLLAFVIFYAGFPIRGLRWAVLVRATGYPLKARDSTEIIFISWLVNCLVPAKLGDLYRAYLLKLNAAVSLSRTFGTVFIERILDLFAIVVLGLAAGFVSFRGRLPGRRPGRLRDRRRPGHHPGVPAPVAAQLRPAAADPAADPGPDPGPVRPLRGGRLLGDRPAPDPDPAAADRRDLVDRGVPALFVVEALGFPDVHLGISGAFFVALTGSLLTAVPFTPAGLGIVEAGIVGVLTLVYNVPQTEALTIVLVDRAISVLSIIALGSLTYAVSPMRRGTGIPPITAKPESSLPA